MKRRGKGRLATLAKWLAIGVGSACVAAAAFVYSGLYDISATDQHTPPVYWLMEALLRRSISVRAEEPAASDVAKAAATGEGFRLYHTHCAQCHGAPGISPEPFALGMTPVPANLVATARHWSAGEIHWVVKYGVKMTGMPAWKYRMSDDEMTQVVAFVKTDLPLLSPVQYRELIKPVSAAPAPMRDMSAGASASGDPDAGLRAMHQYACATCHVIPGLTGATQEVGPPLRGMATRAYIAGMLPNTTGNMVRWLMFPQRVSVRTAMPDLGVKEGDARDIAAYLATLTAD